MIKVMEGSGVPIKMWLDDLEENAQLQAQNLSALPFVFKHVAIMPDSHCGYGMPIGGVIATKNVIIPNAVGVDIGCGICAVKTNIIHLSREVLKQIMGDVRENIPVGFNHHKEPQADELMPINPPDICKREYKSATHQLGTLGGGNHFIEFQKDPEGFVWVMIHSGSRNLGKKVADHYNEMAITLNAKYHSSVPREWELAFLPADSEEGQLYLQEMQYCVAFAFANRYHMIRRIIDVILKNVGRQTTFGEVINIAHNYASLEHHFGENVYVHRKGATLARSGTMGIIAGSQGTNSYIVEGLGNEQSFRSCSHGAGRKMGRGQACKNLHLEDEIKKLDDKGIIHGIRYQKDLDEASGAYKDIAVVMQNQGDLCKIITELTPIAVIKG